MFILCFTPVPIQLQDLVGADSQVELERELEQSRL